MSNTWPYRYIDEDRNWLTVDRRDGSAVVQTPRGVAILAEHLPEIVAKLYEAAGLPAPVVLERPKPREVLVPGPHGGEMVHIKPSPAGHPSNQPGVMLHAEDMRLTGDEPLRVALALIDAMREAETAPDPAEVDTLAMLMVEGTGAMGIGGARPLARKILLAGYRRESRNA